MLAQAFSQCAQVLQGEAGPKALFLRCYAIYVANERSREQEAAEAATPAAAAAACNQVTQAALPASGSPLLLTCSGFSAAYMSEAYQRHQASHLLRSWPPWTLHWRAGALVMPSACTFTASSLQTGLLSSPDQLQTAAAAAAIGLSSKV